MVDINVAAHMLVRSMGIAKAETIQRHLTEMAGAKPGGNTRPPRRYLWLPVDNPRRAAARLRDALDADSVADLARYLRLMLYEGGR